MELRKLLLILFIIPTFLYGQDVPLTEKKVTTESMEKADLKSLAKKRILAEEKVQKEMLGCWTLYFTWAPTEEDKANDRIKVAFGLDVYDGSNNMVLCHNKNGRCDDNKGTWKGTWELINNSYSYTTTNGVIYTGTYRNGIITGKMGYKNTDGDRRYGTFKLSKP
jgi:hypothetical protein